MSVGLLRHRRGRQDARGELERGRAGPTSSSISPSLESNYLDGVSCTQLDVLHGRRRARRRRFAANADRELERTGVVGGRGCRPGIALTRSTRWPARRPASAWRSATPWSAACERTLVERWNGRRWTPSISRSLGRADNDLLGAACTSPSFCIAVGDRVAGGLDRSLVERWNGARWTIAASRNPGRHGPAQQRRVRLEQVLRGRRATRLRGAATRTLAERWNGRSWTTVRSASPNLHSTLWGVSCPRAKLCEAVGGIQAGASSLTLVERWTGTRWASSASANPSRPRRLQRRVVRLAADAASPSATRSWAGTSTTR